MTNKLYVVGFPRSGTSLVMQTLFELKYPVFGIPHPPNRNKEMQPDNKPFWEHSETLFGNVEMLGDSNCAVKVLLRKAIEKIKLDTSDKVIFCRRSPAINAEKMHDWKIGSTQDRNLNNINKWYARFYTWIGNTDYIEINLEEFKKDPQTVLLSIKTFINVETNIYDALRNIS